MNKTMEEWAEQVQLAGTWTVSGAGNPTPALLRDLVEEIIALRKRVAQLEEIAAPPPPPGPTRPRLAPGH